MRITVRKFKAMCLKLLDQVAATGEPVIITKPRGLGTGHNSAEILCSDEELCSLGRGEPWGRW